MNPKWPPLASSRFGPSTAAPPAQWKESRFFCPNLVGTRLARLQFNTVRLPRSNLRKLGAQFPDCRQTSRMDLRVLQAIVAASEVSRPGFHSTGIGGQVVPDRKSTR